MKYRIKEDNGYFEIEYLFLGLFWLAYGEDCLFRGLEDAKLYLQKLSTQKSEPIYHTYP